MNVFLRKYIVKYVEVKGIISANLQIVLRQKEKERGGREEEGGRRGRGRERERQRGRE